MPKPLDLARLWHEMEHELFPSLSFDPYERALYYFLFARTHLCGQRHLRMSHALIAKGMHVGLYAVQTRARKLLAKGCVRSSIRSNLGTMWQVLLPRQILGPVRVRKPLPPRIDVTSLDCFTDRRARLAILRRENGYCFYCLSKTTRKSAVLDHVVPRARGGSSSYRNLVACCRRCNSHKKTAYAHNFVRTLYRNGQLSYTEFTQRLSALKRLSRGQLRISLFSERGDYSRAASP
jgi:5-methylcytosine-specific restriction endonuclease McrA